VFLWGAELRNVNINPTCQNKVIYKIWKMLNSASGAMVKEPNMVKFSCNLCSQLLKSVVFYTKFFF
jgi:hypothetical protein